ncbi:MAG TPA: pyridoxine 5'-phosphate synthase [Polyangia bacterium]
MTKFSVNLNKFALLRNARGGALPDVEAIARRCIAGGVHGLTVHPRPDERHARADDVRMLKRLVADQPRVELNVEGYPAEAYLALVEETRPHQATLVPDAPEQLTSDHGWDAKRDGARLVPILARLRAAQVRSSLFLDPDLEQVEAAARTGADRIELYTESWARAFGTPSANQVLDRFAAAARRATALGLGVNAGHDLNLQNLGPFLAAVPEVLEVSIGHAFICEAFDHTLEGTIDRSLAILAAQAGGSSLGHTRVGGA